MVKDHSDSEKARVLLYAPSHRQDNTYHGLCYTSRGALAGTRNGSTPWRIYPTTHSTMSERSTSELHFREQWLEREIAQWVHPMKDLSDDPSHHERTLYLWATSQGAMAGTRNSSMSPPHEGSIRRPIAPWANALPLSYISGSNGWNEK